MDIKSKEDIVPGYNLRIVIADAVDKKEATVSGVFNEGCTELKIVISPDRDYIYKVIEDEGLYLYSKEHNRTYMCLRHYEEE